MKGPANSAVFLFLVVLMGSLTGCVGDPEPLPPTESRVEPPYLSVPLWEPWGQGIEYASISADTHEGPVTLHLLRFDPERTHVSVESRRSRDGAVRLADPKRLLRESSAVAAVNASPYATESFHTGGPATISGLSLESGTLVSPSSERLWSFYLTDAGGFGLLPPGSDPPTKAYQGAGGFEPLVVDGSPRGYPDAEEARTAIGQDAVGRVYIAVVDGPRRDHSRGATTEELGRWLAWLGLENALNLDGGGSTILLRRRRSPSGALTRRVRTVNRPVAGLLHGGRRPVANVLLIGEGDLE